MARSRPGRPLCRAGRRGWGAAAGAAPRPLPPLKRGVPFRPYRPLLPPPPAPQELEARINKVTAVLASRIAGRRAAWGWRAAANNMCRAARLAPCGGSV